MVNLLQCVTIYGYGYVVALGGYYLQCWVNYFLKVIQLLITNYSSQSNLITN